jgi:hypothetical protein
MKFSGLAFPILEELIGVEISFMGSQMWTLLVGVEFQSKTR